MFGGNTQGRQQAWTMPAYSTSLSKHNPFSNKDVDGFFIGGKTIKIRGILGSAVVLPLSIPPDSLLGSLLRGFRLFDPIIDNFDKEFGEGSLEHLYDKCP